MNLIFEFKLSTRIQFNSCIKDYIAFIILTKDLLLRTIAISPYHWFSHEDDFMNNKIFKTDNVF